MTIVRNNTDAVWSENKIATALARQTFQRKAVVLVPNCNWTGYECDLLVVTGDLRIIDVEVKISRADLKKDAGKDKWWRCMTWEEARDKGRDVTKWNPWDHKERRIWPAKVWKHYYAMPAEIWHDSLLDALPSPSSGVITLTSRTRPGFHEEVTATVVRRATPNRDAYVLNAAQAVDVARLANLRYWDVATNLERTRQQLDEIRAQERATA